MTLIENLPRLIQVIEENPQSDLEEIQELFSDATEDEIKSSAKPFSLACHTLTETLIKAKRAVGGINLLSNAITKLQDHRCQLTPIHSDLCLLCLDSKCLNPAIKFLDIDHTDIKKVDDKDEDVKNVISYYYYGGLIYAAVKNFERASFFFEIVLTMPANVMNPIMQETYKKQIIIMLLLHGKLPENMLPKYTSACVLKYRKQVGHSYLKFANEYATLSHEKVCRIVNNNNTIFQRDENMGFIKQCLTQVHKRNIQRLTKTFLTLPIHDVAEHVMLDSDKEAEKYILNMIDEGEIFARIDQKNGMVVFEDNPEKYDSVSVFQKLQDDMSVSTTLIETLRKLEAETDSKVNQLKAWE